MRDMIFQELRECNRAIKGMSNDKKEAGNRLLCETLEKMHELTNIGRKEGLLALEEAASDLDEHDNFHYLRSMILLIVDGADPELVEELSTAKYFSAVLEGYDALQYLVMLFGCLAIQAGENPRVIEEKLLSLVPNDVAVMYKNSEV